MDLGPVDAGPQTDRGYDDTDTGPWSPKQNRAKPVSRPVQQPVQQRPEGNHEAAPAASDDDSAHSERGSQSSNGSLRSSQHDPPLYLRVGATAEEISGEVTYDSDPVRSGTSSEAESVREQAPKSHRIYKFSLYETNVRYWIIGADVTETKFKLLRIDRTCPPGRIALVEDDVVYDRAQMDEVLTSIDDGNKATGGLRFRYVFWGLLGFFRFTEAYYMLVISKRQQVAMIGGHYIYQIEGTELVPLTTGTSNRFLQNRNPEETRFLGILHNLDLTKSFYFSYAYDITQSLQHNIIRQRTAIKEKRSPAAPDFNSMFVWNHHLLKPAIAALKHPYDWCLPIIHGFIDQASLDIFGRSIYITIIGRRSRHFAGARFLKRGVNDLGYVANDVETEQIVSEMLTTSFHAPGPRLFTNPTYTSYVHHRGSIPLYWTQDNSGVSPKPDIDLNLFDPFYEQAAMHFDNMFERYGCPIYVLNLIKAKERTPRESKLLTAYKEALDYLNQSLPQDKQILYKAFDMSRASKTRGGDVIGSLEVIAEEIVRVTGLFHNGEVGEEHTQVQNGVARTNCIDCLDRTNAAQFVIGKQAFGQQLKALGVIDYDNLNYDTDAVNVFTHMFHDHGDTIAVQYGGSHLVNTMATYRKLNHWQSHSRDMVESFKRYYHNSFLDNQRQEAYNLFLGNYIWAQGQPMLWDLSTDYYLHHSSPRAWLDRSRKSYIDWYNPEHLELRTMPCTADIDLNNTKELPQFDGYWLEYYRPPALSSFLKMYSFRMISTNKYLPDKPSRDAKYDWSPFKPRLDPARSHADSPDKKRKGVTIVDPQDEAASFSARPSVEETGQLRPLISEEKPSILREPTIGITNPDATTNNTTTSDPPTGVVEDKPFQPADKAQMHLWTLNQFHTQSLNPTVSADELREYDRYVAHPLNLPLVVSSELPSDANIDYVEYVQKGCRDYGLGFEDFGEDYIDGDTAGGGGGGLFSVSEQDVLDFEDFCDVRDDPLTVTEDDGSKKRYKAYRQWLLKGKSLFKQSKVDPEFQEPKQ